MPVPWPFLFVLLLVLFVSSFLVGLSLRCLLVYSGVKYVMCPWLSVGFCAPTRWLNSAVS